MEAYFDNSATTRCFDGVIDVVAKVMGADYGNPSSMHQKGVEAEQYLKEARAVISKNLKVNEKEILFTSGGTESNNLALIGTAMANRRSGMHLVTTVIEHASVGNTMKYLEEQGFSVTYVPVDSDGIVDLEALEAAVREDTILVSIMYVNNEIGSVQPIEEISRRIKAKNPKVLFHVDAIQAYGKYRIYPKKMGIDLLSVSGHKIHGPKGIGFLYCGEKVKIKPILFGGGQQKGMRSGTDNVPGVAGLAEAVREIYTDFEKHVEHLYRLKEAFMQGVLELPEVLVNGRTGRDSAPQIVSVSFRGVRSEVLLHALEERGIYVSAGSACSSNKQTVSSTLKGIGLEPALLDSTVRFSFSIFNTEEEVQDTLQVLAELLPVLRRYVRR